MKAFVTVVTEGSFTQAAERLSTSPQLISKYVAQLEHQLNVRLLNRTTRRIHLTEAGQLYLLRAQNLLNEVDTMEAELADMSTQAQGTLRISAPVSFAIQHLGPAIQEFQQLHPKVTVDLQLNDRKVDIVDEGFDIALRIGKLKSSSFVAKRIAPIRLVICAAPQYLRENGEPRHPSDLAHHRRLYYSYADLKSTPESFIPNAQTQEGALYSNNGDVLVAAAMAGAGILMQPTFIVGSFLKTGALQQILHDFEPEPIALYAMFAHRQFMASKVRAFLEFITDYYGEPPYWDDF